jgi:hypothetical protein
VWGCDSQNVWAVGRGGQVLKWDGSTWSYQLMATQADLTAVWGRPAGGLWAAGDRVLLNSPDGTNWQPLSAYEWGHVFAVSGNSTEVWVVGADGLSLRGRP